MGCVISENHQACSLRPPSYHRVELNKSEPTHGIFCGQKNHLVQKINIVSLPKFAYTAVLTLRQHRPQSLQGYSLSDLSVFSKGPIKFPQVANKTGKQVLSYICHPKKEYTLLCLKEHMWVGCLWLTTFRRSIRANVGPKCWIYPASFQPTSLCNHIWQKLYSRWGHAFFPFSLHMLVNCFHKDVP